MITNIPQILTPRAIKINDKSYFKPKNEQIIISKFCSFRDLDFLKKCATDDAIKFKYDSLVDEKYSDHTSIIKVGYTFFDGDKCVAFSFWNQINGVNFIDGYNLYHGIDRVRWAVYGYALAIRDIFRYYEYAHITTPANNKATNHMAKYMGFNFVSSVNVKNIDFNLYILRRK